MHCNELNICVDDIKQLDAATSLATSAKENLLTQHGLSVGNPKAIFCSTNKCKETFGLSKVGGLAFGSFAVAVAPRGWKEHYVAHELIHHWQATHFGSLVLITGEQWLIEGMAYALSDDPREILSQPFESYRQQFREWDKGRTSAPLEQAIAEML